MRSPKDIEERQRCYKCGRNRAIARDALLTILLNNLRFSLACSAPETSSRRPKQLHRRAPKFYCIYAKPMNALFQNSSSCTTVSSQTTARSKSTSSAKATSLSRRRTPRWSPSSFNISMIALPPSTSASSSRPSFSSWFVAVCVAFFTCVVRFDIYYSKIIVDCFCIQFFQIAKLIDENFL